MNSNVAQTCAVTKLLGFRIEEVFTTQQSCSFYFQCTHTGSTKQQFPMVLRFECIIWTSYMERRCFFKTFLCLKLLFLDVQHWVFFQETQTGQPSDNFPWFFDLNPSFERNASRVDALLLSFDVGTFCCLFLMLSIFPQTQTGQSSNNFPWFFDLFTSFRRTAPREYVFILLHSTEGVYFLLDVSFILGDTSSYQNFQFKISLLWKCYFVQSL